MNLYFLMRRTPKMDKLKMHTPNIADENFAALAKLFPNAVTETIDPATGEVVRAIDKDVLMQEINTRVVDGKEERYQFTWPDKKKAVLAANSPISATLRPCREESVDFDTTENLYIEGDNLDVLKLLQETYLGRVKMIYIDPPYNTGNDFVYNDDFAESAEDYLDRSGQYDEDGNRLVQNTESNGRFHTDWLNMIYPRLKLAKSLLSEDGVIFISIDDNEVENLRKVCNEIFGEANMVNHKCFINYIPNGTNKGFIARAHEYILAYAKNIDSLRPFKRLNHSCDDISVERCTNTPTQKNPKSSIIFPKGTKFEGTTASFSGIIGEKEPIEIIGTMRFENGVLADDVELKSSWRNKSQVTTFFKNGVAYDENGQEVFEVFFTQEGKPKYKKRLSCYSPKSVQQFKAYDYEKTYDELSFENPKPVSLVEFLIGMCCNDNDIVLDFFAGSGTTANSVFEVVSKYGIRIKTILIQINENLDETIQQKSGRALTFTQNMISFLDSINRPHILSEIGKERIRRAAKKIAEEHPGVEFDGGFRVLKLDTSNMQDVYYTPAEFTQATLDGVADNIKPDRTPMDLLFQVMLDLGVLLSGKIEENTICGKTVFNVEDNYLIACFDENITDEVITAIAKQKPYYFVMRDSSMADDSVATNFEQIFATYSPDTVRRVL